MNYKALYYALTVMIFVGWWACFASMTNWWLGLIVGITITVLQIVFERALRKVKVENEDSEV